ncbi:MAG: YraN family protein [Coriobacteriia bacterium]|nr:YraN family protein [Coriobacteriia bacterium]MCL2750636.1 YraN family protein [Coriobacteriia bacterium]
METALATKQKKTSNDKTRAKSSSQEKTQKAAGKNQTLGKLGEDLACIYLLDNGFEILERNWKCDSGEADIVATEGEALVFIEVKTRSKRYQGLPEYAVTAERIDRYERIALSYLREKKRPSGQVRFDVIAISMTGRQQCLLRHHRDAFGSG